MMTSCSHAETIILHFNKPEKTDLVSGLFLKKARNVLKSQKREHEFEVILTTFHDRHHRKRRLVELLRSLECQPIVSKRASNK